MRRCRRKAAPIRHAAFLIYTARERRARIPALKQAIAHFQYMPAKIQKRADYHASVVPRDPCRLTALVGRFNHRRG
jgi:hypothetical protein